jgi:hypothetical protein
MVRDGGGGGGALGWTLLGFLAGVAATLGVQILMNGGPARTRHETEAVSAAPVAAIASAAPPKIVKPPPPPSSAAPAPDVEQPQGEVADDAAAAGMTSRTSPTPDAAAPDRTQTPAN